MKKIVLTTATLVAGIMFAHAQGTITLGTTSHEVYTNGTSLAAAGGGSGAWNYEVLDMVSSTYASLTAQQQAGIYNLIQNQTDISLWTDSGVSGANTTLGSQTGGINSSSTTAANWAAPTSGSGYNTAPSYDYYTILGWNSGLGSWATVESALAAGTLGGPGWFGQTGIAYNYAGGGSSGLAAVSLWSPSATTGLSGSGGLVNPDGLTLNPVPEPTTLALAGLGGLSMLFLRRRK